MNKVEMDEYLKSIDGLRSNWGKYERTIYDSGFFEVDSGWYMLIKDLINDLIKLGWDKNVIQVKEKFGGLRFYIDEGSDEIYKRIRQSENDSYTICEICGQTGKIRNDIGWVLTLCDNHHQGKLIERNGRV